MTFYTSNWFKTHPNFNNLVTIFNDTRKLSQNKFKKATDKLIKDSEVLEYDDDVRLNDVDGFNQSISFITGGTVETAYSEKIGNMGKRVAMLNFADALVPGGLVEVGGTTQEENICRCSNLYESLISCPDYYDINDYDVAYTNDHIYTDTIIYSPNVLVFKDDINYEIIRPLMVDVITCPAPNTRIKDASAERIYLNRIRKFLVSAQSHNVDTIILGAWGCGAFGQDPRIVAKCFAKVLKEANAFNKVIFAIRGTDSLTKDSNAYIFEESFNEEYDR